MDTAIQFCSAQIPCHWSASSSESHPKTLRARSLFLLSFVCRLLLLAVSCFFSGLLTGPFFDHLFFLRCLREILLTFLHAFCDGVAPHCTTPILPPLRIALFLLSELGSAPYHFLSSFGCLLRFKHFGILGLYTLLPFVRLYPS